MLVREVMTTTVVTVHRGATIKSASALLADHQVTALPVVDDAGLIVGVISEADVMRDALTPDPRVHLLRVPVRQGPHATYVGEVMTPVPLTVRPDADLAEAARIMTETGVKSLPVTEDRLVIGIVSRTDVVAQLARRDERVHEEVLELLRAEQLIWRAGVVDGVVTLAGPSDDHERRLAEALVCAVPGVVGVRFDDEEPS